MAEDLTANHKGLSKFATADDDTGGDHQIILFIQLPFSIFLGGAHISVCQVAKIRQSHCTTVTPAAEC